MRLLKCPQLLFLSHLNELSVTQVIVLLGLVEVLEQFASEFEGSFSLNFFVLYFNEVHGIHNVNCDYLINSIFEDPQDWRTTIASLRLSDAEHEIGVANCFEPEPIELVVRFRFHEAHKLKAFQHCFILYRVVLLPFEVIGNSSKIFLQVQVSFKL